MFGRETRATETLKLPHPGIAERDFVLWPLADISPDLDVPGLGRVAVLRAVSGGLCDELRRDLPGFLTVALVPAAYYVFMMTVCLDAFRTWSEFFGTAGLILVMSFLPVVVCFWPRRSSISLAE